MSTVVRGYSKLAVNAVQEASLGESCILVDSKDKILGRASKRDCHRVGPEGQIPLHRAFSVFIFNSRLELLLQKRSTTKVTFPGHLTNSCCSHPLYDWAQETTEKDALGVKLAAVRRLEHELGISKSLLKPSDITYLTRVLYKDEGDGIWGEHEIDYILFIVGKDLPLRPNPEEVSEVKYLRRDEFDNFMLNVKDPVTPWFFLIANTYLATWWDNLSHLHMFQDHSKIVDFT